MCLINYSVVLVLVIRRKVSQAVSLPDLPNEDLCEDEIFQYFLLTELGMEIKDNFTCFPRSDS